MTFEELLAHLEANDVRLSLEGGSLAYDAPAGVVTDALVEELRRHKPRLLERLAGPARAVPAGVVDAAPLTFAQKRMWDRLQGGADPAVYNVTLRVDLRGQLDVSALRAAADLLVQRHAALRTRLVRRGGEVVQEVLASVAFRVQVADLTGLREEERQAHLEEWSRREAHRPFALDQAPLMRLHVRKLAEDRWTMLVLLHHIVCDGWSMETLLRELSAAYTAARRGETAELPPLPVQYADYARWEREHLDRERLDRLFDYWHGQLEGSSLAVDLPSDRPRPKQVSMHGHVHWFEVEEAVVARLEAVARRQRTTLYTALLSAFLVLLQRLTGVSDLVLASNVANRGREEHEPIVGLFVNNLALRGRLDRAPTFAALLDQMSQTFFAAMDQALPFGLLIDSLRRRRPGPDFKFPQVIFVLENAPEAELKLPGVEVDVRNVAVESYVAELCLILIRIGGGLRCAMEYPTDLFDDATVRGWAAGLAALLDEVGRNPDLPLESYGRALAAGAGGRT